MIEELKRNTHKLFGGSRGLSRNNNISEQFSEKAQTTSKKGFLMESHSNE